MNWGMLENISLLSLGVVRDIEGAEKLKRERCLGPMVRFHALPQSSYDSKLSGRGQNVWNFLD
jgi:hypothetical protein